MRQPAEWREAVATWERYIATPWLWRYETDAVEIGFALQRLGEMHEQRGETARAVAAYARRTSTCGSARMETPSGTSSPGSDASPTCAPADPP